MPSIEEASYQRGTLTNIYPFSVSRLLYRNTESCTGRADLLFVGLSRSPDGHTKGALVDQVSKVVDGIAPTLGDHVRVGGPAITLDEEGNSVTEGVDGPAISDDGTDSLKGLNATLVVSFGRNFGCLATVHVVDDVQPPGHTNHKARNLIELISLCEPATEEHDKRSDQKAHAERVVSWAASLQDEEELKDLKRHCNEPV